MSDSTSTSYCRCIADPKFRAFAEHRWNVDHPVSGCKCPRCSKMRVATVATEDVEPETLRAMAESESLNGHPFVRLGLRLAADVIERLRAECERLHDIVGLGSYDDEDCTCGK